MTEPGPEQSEAAARMKLVQLAFGHMATQVAGVAAQLKLADAIGDRERSAEELANEYDTPPVNDEPATPRVSRAGGAHREQPWPLQTGTSGFAAAHRPARLGARVHPHVHLSRDDAVLATAGLQRAHRGAPPFNEVFVTNFFSHLKNHPELSVLFNGAMSQGTRGVADALPSHYDFGRFHTVADIGGGDGTLIAAILAEHPQLRGILFDTAEGSAQAEGTLGQTAVSDCCIIEPVLPETVNPTPPPFIYLSDLNMLVNVGGLERTRAEFERLCEFPGT